MGDKRRQLRRLELKRETLRKLVDDELEKIAGGFICQSRAVSGCTVSDPCPEFDGS